VFTWSPPSDQLVSSVVASFLPVTPSLTVADCPQCRGISTVIFGTCAVCFAEFFEDDDYPQPWREPAPTPEPDARPTEAAFDGRHG